MPRRKSSPPHTPHGSWRSRAPVRQAIGTGHSRHMALAVSTSCGDSAKNRSGSSVHGSTDLVRTTGTMAVAGPLTPGTDSVSSPVVPDATAVVAGQYMSIPSRPSRPFPSALAEVARTRFGSAAFWGSRPVFLDRIPSRMRTRVVAASGGDAGHFLVRRAVVDLLCGDLRLVEPLRPRSREGPTG